MELLHEEANADDKYIAAFFRYEECNTVFC